jgi:CRP-like cAMP-binding protein
VTISLDDLARANQRLRQHPLDTGAWLEVAVLLHAFGHADEAEAAFAAIGEGARLAGQVALAVACARHLAELGSVRGPELIDQVVDTYAADGVGEGAVPAARAKTEPPEPPDADPDPVADARALIEKFGTWLVSRKHDKLPAAPLLSALSKSGARALIGVMTARAFQRGTRIIEIGEPATALYWLAHGTVIVTRDEASPPIARETPPGGLSRNTLGELHSGAFFGEIALVGGTKRTARVTAGDDVWVLEIPARAIEGAAVKHPKLAEVLATHARQRLLANLIRTSELFRALGDDDRDALLAKFQTELVPADTTFITEGEENQHLWVVVSGRCEVRAGGEPLAELGPGAAVGEISLVSGEKAVADVVAIEPAVLLRLSKTDFDVVAKKHPKLLAEVKRLVVARETANRALFQDASDLIV